MLAATQVVAGYATGAVCGPFDLVLPEGQIVCLLGANGSGKTTLLRTLLGLIPALGGSILLDSLSLAGIASRERAMAMAYVPQLGKIQCPYTLLDVVRMGRAARLGFSAAPSEKDTTIALECLDRLGMASLAEQSFNRVSGGERQLTLIARALAQQARLLILDEPTASLDFGNQARVVKLMSSLASSGYGVLFSTHDPEHALLIAHHVILISNGRCHSSGPPSQVVTEANLAKAYGIPVAVGPVLNRNVIACTPMIN